ncbi:hypothetical protein IMCC9480_2095 [Oxalobacteraceae bacterium IMCC9480]|nr:hypothetical protein IMCC9480_2095 [Oxalobacteraceae bacterium IMCC9480]
MLDVAQFGGLDIGMRADDAGVVRMRFREQLVEQGFFDDAVGRVLDALAALVTDHVNLVGQCRLVEHVEQITHAVGMDPQRQFELVRRHGVEVVGAIEIGTAIGVGRAGTFEQFVGRAARHVLRGGEHHVFEQMRKTGQAGRFIGRTHVVPEIDGRQWQAVILDQDDVEAIGQCVFFERDLSHCSASGNKGISRPDRSRQHCTQDKQKGGQGQQLRGIHGLSGQDIGDRLCLSAGARAARPGRAAQR